MSQLMKYFRLSLRYTFILIAATLVASVMIAMALMAVGVSYEQIQDSMGKKTVVVIGENPNQALESVHDETLEEPTVTLAKSPSQLGARAVYVYESGQYTIEETSEIEGSAADPELVMEPRVQCRSNK